MIYIVASCTDRKRERPPAALRLRSVGRHAADERAERWWDRLHDHRSPTTVAADLYVGDHWTVARSLPDVARAAGYRAELWVASAGYGLIPASASVRSYSATFGGRHPDSVAPNGMGALRTSVNRAWWTALCGFNFTRGIPRSLAELAQDDPSAWILVVASPDYVSAISNDLLAARKHLKRAARLLVISSVTGSELGELAANIIPSDARLQAAVGGALLSLHARVARKVLQEAHRWNLDAEVVKPRYERLLARSPAPASVDRDKLSDAEVRKFIRTQRAGQRDVTHTRLLRQLREDGKACEQSRFRALFFKETRGAHVH
jgi:hypothetical protein